MGKQKQGHVHMEVNLSAYSTPSVVEDKSKGWVEYKLENSDAKYNVPNGFYLYLYDRAKGSTTNGSVILGMKQMIYGKGLGVLNVGEDSSQMDAIKDIISDRDLKRAVSDRKKLMMCAFQVTKNKGRVTAITYFPMSQLLPEIKDEEGNIKNWFYTNDWTQTHRYEPLSIPAFGFGKESGNEILIIGNYDGESEYFCEDEGYVGCLPYALLEEKIADYQINETLNGFSPTTIVNYNNGIPEDKTKREAIAKDTTNKLTGVTGKKVIISFNNDSESAATVEKIALDNAPQHYEYLSKECESKILKGHRAISELLGFSADSAGFSNNAEELKNKFVAFDNFVINPFQLEFTDALEKVLSINGINEELYFITLEPFEFIDTEGMDKETEEEETGITEEPEVTLSKEKDDLIADMLIGCGEDIGEGWQLVSSQDVDYDDEERLDLEVQELNEVKLSLKDKLINLVSTGRARPNAKSSQDQSIGKNHYKVRYSYEGETSVKSRIFCLRMAAASKLYRKEDIIRMGDQIVNAGWGPGGTDLYSIWLYKGGGGCHHKFVRNTYKFVGDSPKSIGSSEEISTGKSEREGYRVRNPKKVAMMPKDMPNKGFLN
tara:strand:- start:3755 stop:5566 length:1812 start_codon:yes stop_codon:yes gene_type:complete